VIAGSRFPKDVSVDTGALELRGEVWTEQQVIEPQAGIPLPPVSQIRPEGIDALVRVQLANGKRGLPSGVEGSAHLERRGHPVSQC
jgi:hypothetical protein